ncbi:hypothetical protein BDV23DRAFT_149338 [Aspergillus alliaceus]|uniref:Uncharacterized protein n=1 Tax=Petromyces alliaceus TaxID=209559 RepID=A0A5N7CH68_PETAA|nr:hypothetical protein BDV23DRAFT_149338 [Aspergillus alliaceus]
MKRLEDAKYLLEESDDVQQLAQFEQPVELSRYHIYCFEALESLAVIHHTNKESSVAIPLHERAIQGRLHLVGYDADAIIWARNLGYSLEHQQLYKKAFEHYKMWIHTAEQIPELVPLGKMLKRCQDECLRDWRNAYSRGRTLHLPPETNDMSVLYRAISNHSSLICGPLKWFRAWAMGFMIMTIAYLMFSC